MNEQLRMDGGNVYVKQEKPGYGSGIWEVKYLLSPYHYESYNFVFFSSEALAETKAANLKADGAFYVNVEEVWVLE